MKHPALSARRLAAWLALLPLTGLVACTPSRTEELHPPTSARAPYNTRQGEALWAIAPLRNESGTTAANALTLSDKLAEAAGQVRGLRVLPVNRTLEAMRVLKMTEVNSPSQALQLAAELGADAILVGSISSYDPYSPPQLGMSLALVAQPGRLVLSPEGPPDHVDLRYRSSEYVGFPRSQRSSGPISSFSSFLDAKNHQVQADLRTYAIGREEGRSALGWRRYMASMDLYSEFVAWHAITTLLEKEWIRVSSTGGG